eukprot:GHRR01001693.1.p1 GENE.GHRR01001693.1~~GHRR01001693.1.p1  ORF type:complete len:295 (+),score=-39.36 GHRR01001693.1:623-1507(+)
MLYFSINYSMLLPVFLAKSFKHGKIKINVGHIFYQLLINSSIPSSYNREPLFMKCTPCRHFWSFHCKKTINFRHQKQFLTTAAMHWKMFEIFNHPSYSLLALNCPSPITIYSFIIINTTFKHIVKAYYHFFMFASNTHSDLISRIHTNIAIRIKHPSKPPMFWDQRIWYFISYLQSFANRFQLHQTCRITNLSIYIIYQYFHSRSIMKTIANSIQSSSRFDGASISLFNFIEYSFIFRVNSNFQRSITLFTYQKTSISINHSPKPLAPFFMFFFCSLFFISIIGRWAYGLWGSY